MFEKNFNHFSRLDDGVRAMAQSASSGADRVHDPLIFPWAKQIKRKERDYTRMIKIRMDKDETRGQMWPNAAQRVRSPLASRFPQLSAITGEFAFR